MEILRSFILGIIQGITEFVPISSTAHLIIVPWLFSWEDQGLAYSVALHFGSLFAILFYFRTDILRIISGLFNCINCRSLKVSSDGRVGFYLAVATVPVVIVGIFLEGYVSGVFRNPKFVGIFLFLFAILLYLSEKKTKREKSINQMNFVDSLFFGIAQSFAIFPGVSRAGVTITGGLFRNYKREEAAKFSFLLGIPAITSATIFELGQIDYNSVVTYSFLVGVLASFVSAFFVIKFLLNYLKTKTFTPFVIYRILLSIYILVVLAD